MKLDLFNISEFIEVNNCPEVTNPVFWNFNGTPTSDGLFSYELFGVSDEERKNIFGYIDLKDNYLHPMVYLMLIKKSGSLGDIILGNKYAVIADKKIKIVPESYEGAETGIRFLYDHFDEINWINEIEESEIDSIDKKTRLKFLNSITRDECFIRQWLVIPPFYRAESSTNRSMGDSINKLYKELISRVAGMKMGFSFEIFGDETRLRIQNILKDIYLSTLAPVSGKNLILEKGKSEGTLAGVSKNSMVRKHLLGKTIDWSASSVITSPENSKANTLAEKPVPFGYGAFPLAALVSMFQPFYINFISDTMESFLADFSITFANSIEKIDIGQYNSTKIEKLLKKFINAPQNRFDILDFEFTNKKGVKESFAVTLFEFKNEEDALENKNYTRRPMTLTDMIYIATRNAVEDKHVMVTRFPIANAQNIYPSKIKILSTSKTRKVWIKLSLDGDAMYDDQYPTIAGPGVSDVDSKFYDVMLCGNAYLASLGRRLRWRYVIYESYFFTRSQ